MELNHHREQAVGEGGQKSSGAKYRRHEEIPTIYTPGILPGSVCPPHRVQRKMSNERPRESTLSVEIGGLNCYRDFVPFVRSRGTLIHCRSGNVIGIDRILNDISCYINKGNRYRDTMMDIY